MDSDPFKVFGEWFAAAKKSGMREPTAANVATVAKSGAPSSRIVLLKNWDENGFVFYTNANSRKGRELAANNKAALNFYWMEMRRQIRIEGKVEIVKGRAANDYYNSRHLEKRLGAWASRQSEVLESRNELIKAIEEMRKKYGDNPPRPEWWHGFRVKPRYFEFWQEGKFRLHQRDVFEFENGAWKHFQLNP